MPDIFKVENVDTPWGDYSDVLLAGSAYEEDGSLYIERTGPYVPPIIISGISEIVVTDKFKLLMEKELFSGISFEKIVKRKIVEVHWELWDKTKDEPELYPETGEPEDYILLGTHSEEISEKIGDLWSVAVTKNSKKERDSSYWPATIWIVENTIEHIDFFMPDGVLWNCVSQRAKEWLELNCGGVLRFEKVEIG